jgi:hypothetical protein
VVAEERIDLLRVVSREVVEDDVDLQVGRVWSDQIAQDGHECLARVLRGCLSEDVPRKGVECGGQRQRPIAVVLEGVPLEAAGDRGASS